VEHPLAIWLRGRIAGANKQIVGLSHSRSQGQNSFQSFCVRNQLGRCIPDSGRALPQKWSLLGGSLWNCPSLRVATATAHLAAAKRKSRRVPT
jgi:hypothetical protein